MSDTCPRTPLLGDGLSTTEPCPGNPPIIGCESPATILGAGFAPDPGFLNAAADGASLIGVPTVGVEGPLNLGTIAIAESDANPLEVDGGDTDMGTSEFDEKVSGDPNADGPRTRDDPSKLSA